MKESKFILMIQKVLFLRSTPVFNRSFTKTRLKISVNNLKFSSLKMSTFLGDKVKGVLIDIHGVLYESGQSGGITGSVNAIEKLRKSGFPYRFVTNETQRTRSSLVSKLKSFGFSLNEQEIISPGIATASYLKSLNLHPFLLVHPDIEPEFAECERSSPNCVVVGDAAEYFTYENEILQRKR